MSSQAEKIRCGYYTPGILYTPINTGPAVPRQNRWELQTPLLPSDPHNLSKVKGPQRRQQLL